MNDPAFPPNKSQYATSSESEQVPHFQRTLGLLPSVAVNMTQMCGIGPFITIPLMVTTMGGPQAMIGWIVGAVLAMADGLIWAELGASMPGAGGTYLYLREAFQYRTGKLMPFLFVWTAMIYIPLNMSTGVIGLVQYLGYYFPVFATTPQPMSADWFKIHLLSFGVVILTTWALYRNISAIAKLTNLLWVIMIVSVVGVIVASFTHFHSSLAFNFPPGAFHPGKQFFGGLGAGLLIAVYDYLGYNTTAYMGDELRDPGRVLPGSIIYSIAAMLVIYLAMNIGIMGVVPWQDVASSNYIGSLIFEVTCGKTIARLFTALIIITAFASVFTGLLGGSRVPYNAAKDKLFVPVFGRLHAKWNFPHIALIVMSIITAVGTLFDLTTVINMLVALMVLVQCIGQIAAVTVLRKRQPRLVRPYRMFLYPIPSIVAMIGWGFAYYNSGGPAIRWSLYLLAAGAIAFIIWAKIEKSWPFAQPLIREEFLESQDRETNFGNAEA
jgi:amino acid transporter